mmetsp:Transcript_31374/g.94146  ORF Transcript_31374/g.94146 Transcript_31374/m.94146 type:complete len:295 (-) Transcript_31374:1354-2238(-)
MNLKLLLPRQVVFGPRRRRVERAQARFDEERLRGPAVAARHVEPRVLGARGRARVRPRGRVEAEVPDGVLRVRHGDEERARVRPPDGARAQRDQLVPAAVAGVADDARPRVEALRVEVEADRVRPKVPRDGAEGRRREVARRDVRGRAGPELDVAVRRAGSQIEALPLVAAVARLQPDVVHVARPGSIVERHAPVRAVLRAPRDAHALEVLALRWDEVRRVLLGARRVDRVEDRRVFSHVELPRKQRAAQLQHGQVIVREGRRAPSAVVRVRLQALVVRRAALLLVLPLVKLHV